MHSPARFLFNFRAAWKRRSLFNAVDRGHRFVRYENPGKADFPDAGKRSISRTDRFTFDFRGRVAETRPGYFSGARKSGKGWKGETNGTQLPLLPTLLAPGKNIYILSPGRGHCATRNSNSHYFWYTVPLKSVGLIYSAVRKYFNIKSINCS